MTIKDRQTGYRKNLLMDMAIKKALRPGKRISKRGKIYYEYRKNRSDRPGKDI